MPPRKPLYTSPLLAIQQALQGGKQPQQNKAPVFGVPQSNTPSFPVVSSGTAQSTAPMAVKPPTTFASIPNQTIAPTPQINPLEIIRQGKDQVIRAPLATERFTDFKERGVVASALFGNQKDKEVLRDMQRRGIEPGFFSTWGTEGFFSFLGRDKAEQRERLTDDLVAKGIEPSRAFEIAVNELEKRDTSLTKMAEDIRSGDKDRRKRAMESLDKLDLTTEEKVAIGLQRAGQAAGSALELADFATAGTLKPIRRAATESIRKSMSDDMVLENMARLKSNPLQIPPDDFTRFDDLAKQMDRRPLSPDEMAEAKAIVERVDGALPNPEVGAMDIKPASIKTKTGDTLKIGDEIKVVGSDGEVRLGIVNKISPARVSADGKKIPAGFIADFDNPPLFGRNIDPQKWDVEKVKLTTRQKEAIAAETKASNYAIDRIKQVNQPTPRKDYPGLKRQGGFADFFAPVKAKETAPTVKPKTEQRIKIDADISDIRKSLQNKDLTANQIGELETRLSIMEESIPDVSLIRRIAGKQITNDSLSQVQATAQKIVAQSDFHKAISLQEAQQILGNPKKYTTRQVEAARVVRRANLDQIVTEAGYSSLDDAGRAINQFDQIKEQIADVKLNLKEVKSERALSNKVKQVVTTATAKRRDEVKFLKDQFMLTDSDVRKATGGRDFRTMSEGRFNDVVRNMEQIGIQNADKIQAKAELMDLMERRQFEKVENYRRAQELPPLSEMNAAQFRQYAEALEQFQTNDTFLTQRQLEVVDRSSLKGVRTIREARERLLEHIRKMPGLENTKIEDLNVAPTALDYVRYDTSLAEKNPFYNYLVTRTQEHMLVGEAEFLTTQAKVLDLAKKANQSRNKGIKQLFVPKHEEIIQYLEAPVDEKATFAKALTKEELEYANFVSDYYSRAYDHLVMQKELYGSRYVDQYFTHIRRTFLEAWTDEGFVKAMKEWWQSQKDSLMVANIIDQDTGDILPKSKFFQYTMQRTGEITPSKNLTRVFLQYSKTFERKKMFDRMIPEMDIYVQSLTPTGLTKSGLETDRTLKKFFNQYINNKKGRTVPVTQLITQNNPVDIGLRMGNSLVSIIDLGFSVIAQSAATVGEFVATYQGLGKVGLAKGLKRRLWDTGLKRMSDPNAKKILADNEQFIGRNLWTELAEVDTPLTDKAMQTMFGGFSQATAEANKIFLLSNLTEAELKAGVISPQRLAQLRLDAGRWRDMGKDVKSIVGSTSVGQMITKYKGWAIPIARTNISNLNTLSKKLAKGDMRGAVTSKELQETYRLVELSAIVFLIGQYVMAQDEDDTFVGQLKARAYMEANTLMSGIDPTAFASTPRLITFTQQLLKNIKSIVLLETYNTDSQWGNEGDLKGIKGLQRQLTPATIRSVQKPASSTGDKELDEIKAEESKSRKEATDKIESVFREVENMTPDQRRERLLQEEPDVINKVVDKLVENQAKQANPEQFKKDSQIRKLTNESKAKYVLTQIEKMPVEERRDYIKGLLERGVISANVVNRLAELANERDIIEQ